MIKLNDLCFSYDGKAILQHLTHSFSETGIIALMGPSGEGKTTLLRLLCGLEKPQSGSVEVAHRKIAYAFQEPRLISWLNCEDNIKFVLPKEKQGLDFIHGLLRDFELEDAAKLMPNALSGGMKQRLSLCRALATGADLLLLDEPFSALDAALKARIAPLVRAANPHGLTLVVTHDPADAALLGAAVLELVSDPVSRLLPK